MTDAATLSAGVVALVGARPWPLSDRDAALARFGPEVLAAVEAVLAELDAVRPDWARHDLGGATDHAVMAVRARHPELSDEAVAALGRAYSYGYR